MFGQPTNTSFSGFNSTAQASPFGQSAFGKPITTTSFGSGTTPVFGSGNTSLFSSKPTGSTSGGLFGSTSTPPAFRQTTTQPSFGGFGTTNTSTNLFGAQQNVSTNLFGTSTGTSAFGQANKPGGFTFGNTTTATLFGQPQQSTQQTTPFGQTNTTTNTNLFGTAGGFGSPSTTTGMTGTVVKFQPVITTDSMLKNGISQNINVRHYCIASMKEYESKSYEELRYEDYLVGRKGPGTGPGTGLFGTPAQSSPFGTTATGTSTAGTGFGGMSGGFGTTTQSGTSGLFGKPITSFGTPTTTTSSFPFNATSTSSLFGTSTQAKPFGTAAPTPLFATSITNQTAGTGFGGINTPQNTGFGSTFGSTQPNQSIGLFNQNKSAFNIPSTSTSTAFTAFGQTPSSTTGTNLFGPKSTGTTGFGNTSTFGSTTSTFGTGTGFGTNQPAGSSLFGPSFKPPGQTSGFAFGSTSTPSTGLGTNTGLTLGGGSSLFGQQKPGGLFGTTGTGTTFNIGGAFGSSSAFGANTTATPGLGTNLLGASATTNQATTSGTVPVHQQILALVSAPFGDSPLLKNLLPASGKTEELLKPANAAAKILNGPQYKVSPNNKSPKIKTRVVNGAQLTKKSLFEGLEEEDPVLSEAFQPRPNAKRLVLRPKPMTNSSGQGTNENSQLIVQNGVKEDHIDTVNVYSNGVEPTNKENHNQENNVRVYNQENNRRSSASWLKSTIPRKTKVPDEDDLEAERSPFVGTNITEEPLDNTVAELRPHNNVSNQSQPDISNSNEVSNTSFSDKTTVDITINNTDSSQEVEENPFSTTQINSRANLAKVTLRRVGYYTIPSLDKLDDYVCGESCIVPNFTIGREGYGNVYFPDSFDIYGLNLDEIVHFRHKEVIIYPDDEKKPPVGQGLNRKAQVTLDRVWPHDKSLHEPITDPHRLAAMNYEGKLRRVSAKHDTRFLEYRPETGSWVFKVDHFSKYGLSDSDEEDNNVPPHSDAKKLKGTAAAAAGPQKGIGKLEESKSVNKDACNGITTTAKVGNGKHPDIETYFPPDVSSSLPTRDYNSQQKVAVSPTATLARITGTDSHKLQLMKASFFDNDNEDMQEDYNEMALSLQKKLMPNFLSTSSSQSEQHDITGIYAPILKPSFMIETSYLMDEEQIPPKSSYKPKLHTEEIVKEAAVFERVFPGPVVTPLTAVLKCHSEVVPLKDSIINRVRFRCIADTGIQMGRMFKPNWGPGLTLLSLSTQDQAAKVSLQNALSQLGSYVSGRILGDNTSMTIVQRLQILGGNGADEEHIQAFKESIVRHLRIQLDHCTMGQEGDCPALDVSADKASVGLHAHSTLAQELADLFFGDASMKYSNNIWKLCVALWGNLPDINTDADSSDHHNVVVRREAVGDWLRSVVQKSVDKEIAEEVSDERIILSYLSAFQLEEACERARKVGDHCIALLMAQMRSGLPVKELIKQQLAMWQNTDVDENLTIDRLKLFMLIAGEPLISSNHGTINVCEGLDWKRALAVHLWYLSSPTASIADILDLYESSFNTAEAEVYAAAPVPDYRENEYETELTNGKQIYDLTFHILKLYCTGNHPMGELLNPSTHTADPTDYRLCWLMQQILTALGYSHISPHVAALTHVNFATQLEAYGLWHWAIFVMLHLKDTSRRRTGVLHLLEHHVEIDDDLEYVKREQFLREELGIPSSWISYAKAVKSRVSKRYGEAAWYFIQAEQWNEAHEIIIEHLAADAIINENYDYLRSLLIPLKSDECSCMISGWAHKGQLLLDYMEITLEIEALLRDPDARDLSYKLESLKPRLTNLCLKINHFPCPTAKHRLCQAEIAKRTLHLAKNLLLLPSSEDRFTTRVLVNLISELPLPEDYAQQELRPIVNMCVNEVIAQSHHNNPIYEFEAY